MSMKYFACKHEMLNPSKQRHGSYDPRPVDTRPRYETSHRRASGMSLASPRKVLRPFFKARSPIGESITSLHTTGRPAVACTIIHSLGFTLRYDTLAWEYLSLRSIHPVASSELFPVFICVRNTNGKNRCQNDLANHSQGSRGTLPAPT